jgi:hypothetical protein
MTYMLKTFVHDGSGKDEVSAQVCSELSEFFNQLVINLDGAKLQYRGLRFAPEHPDCVVIDLSIFVEKFPNPVTITF